MSESKMTELEKISQAEILLYACERYTIPKEMEQGMMPHVTQ